MTYMIAFYWFVAGIATFLYHPRTDHKSFVLSLLLGGFVVPALVIAKVMRA